MAMQDMKHTAAEKKAEAPTSVTAESPDYPYGLRLRLGKDELVKLGFSKLPQVGDEFEIAALAHVVSVSASEREGGEGYKDAELQITHLQLDSDEDKEEAAQKLYGGNKRG